MGGNSLRALVALTLAASSVLALAPSAPATEEGISIPVPRAGSVYTFLEVRIHPGTNETIDSATVHHAFPSAPASTYDGGNQVRTGYAARLTRTYHHPDGSDYTASSAHVLDLATREVFLAAYDGASGWTDSAGVAEIGSVRRVERATDMVRDATLWSEPLWRLQGMLLEPGDVVGLGPGGGAPLVAAHGWQEVDGERLFRLTLGNSHIYDELWYDGASPLPVRRVVDAGGWWSWPSPVATLVDASIGTGPVLEAGDYEPVPWRFEDPSAPATTYTADGPGEAFSARYPLQLAARAARAEPEAAAWLVEHPDAYLVTLHAFETATPGELVHWDLTYGYHGGSEQMTVRVEGDGAHLGVPFERVFPPMFEPASPYSPKPPAASALVGREMACWDHAFTQLEVRFPDVVGREPLGRSVSLEIVPSGGEWLIRCRASFAHELADERVSTKDSGYEQTQVVASGNGYVQSWSRHAVHQTTTVASPLVPEGL